MGAVACAPLQPPLIASSSGGQQHRRASSSAGSMLSAGLKRELETAASSSSEAGPVAAATPSRETAESAPASISQQHQQQHQQHHQQQHQQQHLHHHQQQHPHASTTSLPSSTAAASSIIHQRLPDRQRMNGHELPAASQPAFRPAQGSPTPTASTTIASTSTRIKVRDLSHIQSFASEEAAGSSQHRPGGLQRQYEISSMPVADVIEMVAGLLTKITTTNDRQHEHLHRHIPRAEQRSLPPQTTSVLAFHGKNVPGITILNYLSRIHKYCPTTYEVFISLLVYFDRMTETVNSHLLQQMHRRAHLRPNPSIRTMSTSSSSNRPHTSSSSPFFSPANANNNNNNNNNSSTNTTSRRFSSRRSTETSIARAAVSSKQHLPTSPVDHPMRSPSVPDEHDQDAEHDLSDSDDDLSDVSDELNFSHFLVVDSYNIHRLVIAGVTCANTPR
ncbi:hypothetical protein TEQG_08791 [Trichophyton equinum CBS 127.97]|uniref:Uncharacterized protein n=1 Tax=Trichophyton equinum (strain ATCC MYA-4606 / CBS 127.97) TaxID=559882 RepID=F2Q2X3_TRIEC|nr:hypothetical protein TEQG_08791 [Trichophyton equinum CBS 127.97]